MDDLKKVIEVMACLGCGVVVWWFFVHDAPNRTDWHWWYWRPWETHRDAEHKNWQRRQDTYEVDDSE